MRLSRLAWLNLGVKVLLLALILFYFARPDLEQFTGKVMPLRATFYPLVALLLPVVWWLRRPPGAYPHLPDALLVSATITDFGGNALAMYEHDWFDHLVHFTNVTLIATASGLLLASTALPRAVLAALVVGFGAVVHTMWEIAEFTIDTVLDADLDVTAPTTIRDLSAGLVGCAVAALLVYRWLWRRTDLGGELLPRHSDEVQAPESRGRRRAA